MNTRNTKTYNKSVKQSNTNRKKKYEKIQETFQILLVYIKTFI